MRWFVTVTMLSYKATHAYLLYSDQAVHLAQQAVACCTQIHATGSMLVLDPPHALQWLQDEEEVALS